MKCVISYHLCNFKIHTLNNTTHIVFAYDSGWWMVGPAREGEVGRRGWDRVGGQWGFDSVIKQI